MEISIFGIKFRVIILILIVIIFWILFGHLLWGCCTVTWKKEGFTPANTNFGESQQYTLGDYKKVNTHNWGMPTLLVDPGKPINKAVQKVLNRPEQPIPLPAGQLSMFDNTPFLPECCPNAYSNSSGCACMTTQQYNYLVERGGNNVPYSEY